MKTLKELSDLSSEVIGAAIDVQKELGSGLLESIYHECLKVELDIRGIKYCSELEVQINYKGLVIDSKLKCDLLVEDILVLELKAANDMHSIWDAQTLTYMKLLKAPKGLILNFNRTPLSKEGTKSLVNEYHRLLK